MSATTVSVSVSVSASEQFADASRASASFCHSPSSIAEVDDYSSSSREASEHSSKRRKVSCADSPSASSHHPAPPSPREGDDAFVRARDATAAAAPPAAAAAVPAADARDINAALARDRSSAPTRKRRLSQSASDGADAAASADAGAAPRSPSFDSAADAPAEPARARLESDSAAAVAADADTPVDSAAAAADITLPPTTATDSFEPQPPCAEPAEPLASAPFDAAGAAEGSDAAACREDAAETRADDDVGGVSCSSGPWRRSRRTLYIEYWSRTDECKERKWDHLDAIAEKYGCAEDHIFDTTLRGRTACLEPNMFPYDTPAGIEHWTLWHVRERSHGQIKQYVENWIDANAPHVESWNYDDNPERSIDIFHVHVYLQVADGASVLQGRSVDDLMHEMD